MAIKKPDNQSPANLNAIGQSNSGWINNYKQGQHKELGLEILKASSTNKVYLKPVTTIDGESAYIINIKGKVYEIDCQDAFSSYWKLDNQNSSASTSGIDLTNKIGYRVDGSSFLASGDDALLIWAFANDSGTEFAGFGLSKYPVSVYNVVASGTRGSLATLSNLGLGGSAPARTFTVGSTVLIRNTVGTWPFQWNYGTIQSIPSNTSITVQLYPTLDFQNTDLSSGVGYIYQMDKYFPWNGRTDTSDQDDRIFKQNYRLIAAWFSENTYRNLYTRKADSKWVKQLYGTAINANIITAHRLSSATTSTIVTPLARLIPPWSDVVILRLETERQGWDIEAYLNNYWDTITVNEWQTLDNYSTGVQRDQIPLLLNQNMLIETELTTVGAGTTAGFTIACMGYRDGGLIEL